MQSWRERLEPSHQRDQGSSSHSYLAIERKVASDGPGAGRFVLVHLAPSSVAHDERAP
jgi:hypothetical protein